MEDTNQNISGNDLGFGNKATVNNQRMLNRDGSSNIKRIGLPFFRTADTYNKLITMSWIKFILLILISYILINTFFAFIYVGIGIEHFNGINGSTYLEKFLGSFFFSAQTISTVGYGHISPKGTLTSFVAALESLMGLMAFAFATGLLYGRFSRPMAKIIYSKNILVAPYEDKTGLMIRLANYRSNQLIEIEAELLLTINLPDEAGNTSRKFFGLKLERSKINLLTLSWTIVHPLDSTSPLYNLNAEDLKKGDAELMILIKAFDDTFSQTVHSRTSYKYNEVVFNAKFQPVFYPDEGGIMTMDLSKINDYVIV
ncbi:MAG: ion transporter [Pyrinomonadaceae bacterium]|nr:ion transporter [Sphingobacteriaceae bacterium]